MTIAIYTHPDCLKHDTGPSHPECAERLVAIMDALKNYPFSDKLEIIKAPLGTYEQILLAHTKGHLQFIKDSAPTTSPVYLDGDTIMSQGTLKSALRAVGAGCAAVDDVMDGKYSSAFCAVRPPGHHATKTQSMGFCIFNNIAIAALYSLKKYKLERIAIVDFDVHHGNGTQDILEHEKRILYISTHQSPLFPGTGESYETGVGNIINLPIASGTNGRQYREIFAAKILPALEQFQPQLLLVSAGFDAHHDDPLAGLNLVEDDYHWIGEQLHNVANKHCQGKVISFLEGGYNLDVLGKSVVAYLQAYIESNP